MGSGFRGLSGGKVISLVFFMGIGVWVFFRYRGELFFCIIFRSFICLGKKRIK